MAAGADMTAVFREALGSDFDRLHPELQRRFGFSSVDGHGCVARGVMDRVWHGGGFTRPFLWLGSWRNILVPMAGVGVPFTNENFAYLDTFGRETLSIVRTFELAGSRRGRFDATMVHSRSRGRIVDYLGTHQHLAVDIDVSVDQHGALVIRSGAQRFYEGPVAFSFPMLFSGRAFLREGYDDDAGRFTIDVTVRNTVFGPLFGYTGSFTCTYPETPDGAPSSVKPVREERRE